MSKPTIELRVPSVGESVSEVEVGEWQVAEGGEVRRDATVVILETDKATVEVPAPEDGRLVKVLCPRGAKVKVGEVLGLLEPAALPEATPEIIKAAARKKAPAEKPTAPAAPPPPPAPAPVAPIVMPAAARLAAEQGVNLNEVPGTGPGGRILKEDVQRAVAAAAPPPPPAAPPVVEPVTPPPAPAAAQGPADSAGAEEEVVPMSLLRRKIAERLVQAQQTAALLTTFNEVDMSAVQALRKQYQEAFQQKHQVKLGIMSFFVKAVVAALQQVPGLNAEIRGANIVYHKRYDIGIAIGGGRGLVVPVLRRAERMSFAQIEQAIADYAARARENKLRPEDLTGGTFTITNGGVYGSMLSTPLINPPQSGVLGMHAIQERPVAVGGQVVIRPIMYVALTYDHRLVDGREAVTFLKTVKEFIENPARLLLEV
ncbi:2-oxoglutarate dehydrogenase complex dihydrolipoyllysine-residue succinyltransferase [Fontisphaera persica]|uniref:2-oxoglutarate dehydrogenase complex dihydrolipoyllysine-residue succinyltransferase n=1 Tax=Fontisphaera persica TaxID=2974023 RepID=UPI0024BF3872|nr:2-oxoglutarate dehydrogenase complex dihydrolipoyllysine-residue succinyltransferase [Fontisphaera persica]WCJ58308.1 2-oxoglutarate dehydrogenase complex dihydrolipoyllysine-residue succinyltransferase [Fontisphaera persica]